MFVPSWGKFWLAVLGVFEWDGFNSIMPELWLLPHFLPVHPWRWWCHCRMVYLPMAYAYGHRIKGDPKKSPVIASLRSELYNTPYDTIKWATHRNSIAKRDLYTPQTYILKALNLVGACVYTTIRPLSVATALINRSRRVASPCSVLPVTVALAVTITH